MIQKRPGSAHLRIFRQLGIKIKTKIFEEAKLFHTQSFKVLPLSKGANRRSIRCKESIIKTAPGAGWEVRGKEGVSALLHGPTQIWRWHSWTFTQLSAPQLCSLFRHQPWCGARRGAAKIAPPLVICPAEAGERGQRRAKDYHGGGGGGSHPILAGGRADS